MKIFPSAEKVLNSASKLAILRVLCRGHGFRATGREIAKLAGYSAPAAHEALKELLGLEVVTREIFGRQHVYALNEENRLVDKVIRPIFKVDAGLQREVREFLKAEIKRDGLTGRIAAIILYGSAMRGAVHSGSDVDIAVVVARDHDVGNVSDEFRGDIARRFKTRFGVQLDAYVRSAAEFRRRLKHNQPPVSTLMKSYAVLYGKEPLEV